MIEQTTQRWFGTVLTAMVVVVLAGTVIGAETLAGTAAVSNRLSDKIAPARTEAGQLRAALVDQETGVRGYLLSGDRQFLDPYAEGQTAEQTAATQLRDLLSGETGALGDLAAVEQEAATWRAAVAEPLINNPRSEVVGQSKAAFDRVRLKLATLDARLTGLRDQARVDLTRARRRRDAVLLAMVIFLLALIAAIAVLLRLAVLRPLARLGEAARRVADGDFSHRLEPRGPRDLVQLGQDVDGMRERLVAALTDSQRSNADLEQFAYVASHDLQEPLRKVASFCQLLQRRYADALDDRAQQYIGFAVDGASRMQRLINDLLTFSRIGRMYDSSRPVPLDDVLDEVERSLALALEESGAVIERPPLPTVVGDATLLTMLWQNLIGNAVKFRKPDVPPVIRIEVSGTDDEWTFTLRDNGIGIEPEFADKIFVIFQRLHSREKYSGTGIGLAIGKKVVEFHGGSIRLDEDYRDGAGFIFTLPGAGAGAGAPAAQPVAASAIG
ncbi:CHASE3 domain-containing protein [Actinoplanes sp. NPDC051343]|uniref:sensor histidine kinase n=1 Tax=Actinoplanes sp. NPDC051343 TaxID=3363906 RepID=UPI0037A71AD5